MIPIIGQVRVKDYFFGLHLVCSCGHEFVAVGRVGSMQGCPNCPLIYRADSIPVLDPTTGTIACDFSVGRAGGK